MKKRILEDVSLMMLGAVLFGTAFVGAQELLSSSDVVYSNTDSGSVNDTVQGALDDLYDKTNGLSPLYGKMRVVGDKIYYDTQYIGNYPVYFNPVTGEKCDDYVVGNSDTGHKDGCMKWYAYSENSDGTVNMILDHNTTATVAWKQDTGEGSTNVNGPGSDAGEVLYQLKEDTKNWSENLDELKDYVSYNETEKSYTIDYSEYKARLISAEEIADITENTNWTLSSRWFFFDTLTMDGDQSLGSEKLSKYWWLFNNLGGNNGNEDGNCMQYGCKNGQNSNPLGYWTSSADFFNREDRINTAWRVYYQGRMNYSKMTDYIYGVRPVITISKDKLQ